MERFNPTEFGASQKGQTPYLQEVYRLITEREPDPSLTNLDLVEVALEGIDSPNWIPTDLAKEAAHEIMQLRDHSDPVWDKRALLLIRTLEEGPLQRIYDLKKAPDEMHMDDEDILYRRFKSEQETTE